MLLLSAPLGSLQALRFPMSSVTIIQLGHFASLNPSFFCDFCFGVLSYWFWMWAQGQVCLIVFLCVLACVLETHLTLHLCLFLFHFVSVCFISILKA